MINKSIAASILVDLRIESVGKMVVDASLGGSEVSCQDGLDITIEFSITPGATYLASCIMGNSGIDYHWCYYTSSWQCIDGYAETQSSGTIMAIMASNDVKSAHGQLTLHPTGLPAAGSNGTRLCFSSCDIVRVM